MFRYDGTKWVPFDKKVSYTTTYEYYTDDNNVDQTLPNLKVTQIILTDAQKARLEQVRYMEDMGIEAITKFVMTEELPTDNPDMVKKVTDEKAKDAVLSLVDFAKITPEQVTAMKPMFRTWDGNGVYYKAGEPILDEDILYKVLPPGHTSQLDWKPSVAVSLFAKILTSPGGTPKPWVQPNSTNPYMKGDRVVWTDGKIYESTIDNNVWSPVGLPTGWKAI